MSKNLKTIVQRGLDASPVTEVLIEQSVIGWKEFEMEVMRDRNDNVVIICSIENIDPMGVHTGDSITVAPIQTLTDKEYQRMRDASIAVIRAVGVETGGSNIQFAINPGQWRHDRRGDEPAREPVVAHWQQGDGISDRQTRGEAWPWDTRWTSSRITSPAECGSGRLSDPASARTARRLGPLHQRLLRADDRLRRHQDPPLDVRKISGCG